MKLTTRGFTLVELMIVIAIIGILAAALFPSLTSYLARGRDTSRAAGIKEISTAVAAYTVDNTAVPNADSTNCAPKATIQAKYLPKWPTDISVSTHCTTAGEYGYGTGTNNGTQEIALTAFFENPNGGNIQTASGIAGYQGAIANAKWPEIAAAKKGTGAGSGYVIAN